MVQNMTYFKHLKLLSPLFVLLTCLIYSSTIAHAQSIVNAKRMGSTGADEIFKLTTDKNGFIYALGYYSGTLNIDSAGSLRTYAGFGGRDIFLGKFTCDFNPVWVNRIGSNQDEGGAYFFGGIEIDSLGDVYIVGTIGGNATFTTTSGAPIVVNTAGGSDGFFAKYDNNGVRQWVVRQGGSQNDVTHDLKIDADGFIYVGGGFRSSATFTSTSGQSISRVTNGGLDAYILKYNKNGILDTTTIRNFGSGTDEFIISIESDLNGHLYFSGGTCCVSAPFNIGSTTINNLGDWGGYFFKTNRNLDIIWVNQMGNAGGEGIHSIKYGDSNHIYIYGQFTGSAIIASRSPGIPQNISSAGGFDLMVAKYDSSGVLLFGKRYGSSGQDQALQSMILNNRNEPIITGMFSGTVNFDGNNLTSFGGNSAFVVKLNSSLNATNAWRLGGTGNDFGKGLALGLAGEVYASGWHTNPGIFGTLTIGTYGGTDGYIAKISKLNPPSVVSLSGSACTGFLLSINNVSNGVSYQWLRNNIPIVGANQATYNATISGSFRVIVTTDCISDTSDNFNVQINLPQNKSIDTVVCFGTLLILNGTDTNVSSFNWSPSMGLSNINSLTPSISVSQDISYILTKNLTTGCSISDTFSVKSRNCCFSCASLPGSLGSGLAGCYEFSGNTSDGSPFSNNGIPSGASLSQDRFAKNAQAYQFNGLNSFISVPSSASLDNIDTTLTITFWAKIQSWSINSGSNFASIVSKTNSSSVLHFKITILPNGYIAQNDGKTWFQSSLPINNSLNNWDFYGISISGNTCKFYKNGVLIDVITTPTGTYTLNKNNQLVIGKGDTTTGDFLNGRLDDIRIYNRQLTDSYLRDIYIFSSTDLPPSINAGTDTIICNSVDSIQLLASGNIGRYNWLPSSNLSDSTILNPQLYNPSSVSMIVSNTVGTCVVFDTVNISLPNVTVHAGSDSLVCKGDSIQLSGTANYLFKWRGNGYISDTLSLNPYIKPDTTTSYIILSSFNGCVASDTVVITVPIVTANAGSDKSICYGDSIRLSGSAIGNFQWNTSNQLSDSTIVNPYVKPDSSTVFILTSSSNGCKITDSVIVQVNKPVANAGTDVVICKFDSIQLNANGSGNLAWFSAPEILDTTVANPFISPKSTKNYILSSRIAHCVTLDTVVVSVIQVEANAGEDRLACLGDTVHLTGQAQGKFYWSPSLNLSDSISLTPIATALTDVSYVLTASDSGCVQRDTVTISILGNLVLNAGIDTTICKGDTIQLNATNGVNYRWSPSYNISDTSIDNPMIWPVINTDYIVKSYLGNCIFYDTISIAVRELPTVYAGKDTSICFGEEIMIGATSSATLFRWTPSLGLSDSNILNPIAKPLSSSVYRLLVSDGKCFNTDSLNIDVIDPPSITAESDFTICEGESIQLSVTGTSSVVWSPGGSLSDSLILNPIATPLTTTTFIASTTEFGCISSDTVVITVNPLPFVDAGADSIVCENTNYNFVATASGADIFEWTPDTSLSNPNILNPSAFVTTPIVYKLIATSSQTGCKASDSIQLTPERVYANFEASRLEGIIPLNIEFNNLSVGATSYIWNFGDGQSSNETSPKHLYSKAGEYLAFLIALSDRGCTDTAEAIKILATDKLIIFIPNVFTPNGDGINDDFQVVVSNMDIVKYLKGSIWNRWGGKVYEFEMPNGKWWDGTANGTIYAESVYVYIIEVEDVYGKVHNFNGTITLIR